MQNSLSYSGFFVFVQGELKLLNFLVDSVLNYRYAYVEIHFHPWFILWTLVPLQVLFFWTCLRPSIQWIIPCCCKN